MTAYEPANKTREHKCIGFSEALALQREKREARGGQPWIARKLAVGIAIALVGYTAYVYVARFCVPMIRREGKAFGNRTMGIAFLVVFSMLFLMFGWAYARVVLTSPGYAVDYVSQTPSPIPGLQTQPHPGTWDSDESIAGSPYNSAIPASRSRSRPSIDIPSFSNSQQPSPRSTHPSRSPSHSRRNTHDTGMSMSQIRSGRGVETGPLDAIPPVASARAATSQTREPKLPPAAHLPRNGNGSGSGLPPLLYARRPPTHPALLPEYRYCTRDSLVKPMRAHHCRSCGTCVLKYDHHCPWIGQCVGAFNHKFFVNFLQWSTVFTVFVFVTVITLNALASASSTTSSSIDAQHIVIIVLSGIFTLFTCTLFLSHVHLILLNTSTVEHMGMQRMRERESSVLSEMTRLPCPCSSSSRDAPVLPETVGHSPFRVLRSRRRILQQWNAEWGKIETEGNLWWLGSKRANWEATMGRSKWGWILPVGHSQGNGLTYPTNPRFDRDGRWRRRAEWPDGLR